jgi:G6PDH family F420-dependent oxidoreductase
MCSDHLAPWSRSQGHSGLTWAWLGAALQATERVPMGCFHAPGQRYHPVISAQAFATLAAMFPGRFPWVAVGSGEALNEHVTGDRWPPAGVRLAMLEEAVEVIRRLHGGKEVTHHGEYYDVENARLHSAPDGPVPIYVSAFGPQAVRLAARIGDGYCLTMPDADLVTAFREQGGGDKPVQGGMKVCWAATEDEGVATAHRLWPNDLLPGGLAQTLPTPAEFEAASSLVTEDMVRGQFASGPDPEPHVARVQEYVDAGVDEVYVQQIGPEQEAFFEAWATDVLPRLSRAVTAP